MRVIVDTYNVLHLPSAHELPDGVEGIARLSELIAGSRFGQGKVVLVCDGRTPGDLRGRIARGIRVVFSGQRINADTVIQKEVAKDSGARDLLVVSSDREVQRDAKRGGARVVDSEVFLAGLLGGGGGGLRRDGEERSGEDDASASWWMRAFGFESDESESEGGLDPEDPSGWGVDGDWWVDG